MANPNSLTGQYLSGKKKIPVPAERRTGNGKVLRVIGAAENNLEACGCGLPPGHLHRGHRRLRQRQVLSGQRGALQAPGGGADAHEGPPGQVRPHRGPGISGQGGGHRPEPHRPHAPVQSRHLYGPVQRHPGPVRLHPGGQEPGLRSRAVQLQRPGRPVRGLLRRRPAENRDALPAGCVRSLRGLQGQAVQPGDPGGAL